jgi:hypothetical protein
MARRVKVVQVEDRGEVTVKEVSPYGVWQAYQAKDDRIGQLVALLDDAVTPGFATIKTWYPSEQEQVIDAFLAVNSSFFEIARKLKVEGPITEIVKKLGSGLPELFADLFRKAMSEHGITAGLSLSPPSSPSAKEEQADEQGVLDAAEEPAAS